VEAAMAPDSDLGRVAARALHPSALAVAGAEARTVPGVCGKQTRRRAQAGVVLVEGWDVEPPRVAVELAGAEVGLAARVAAQELAAAVRAKVDPVAEDRAVENPVEVGEAVVSAALAA